MPPQLLHPLRVVSHRTGLTPDLIRAWERRYRVVSPRRSAGGQRLYSDEDILHLARLHRAVLTGRSIGQVATLSRDELARLVESDAAGAEAVAELPDELAHAVPALLDECMSAVLAMDAPALERTLRRAALSLNAHLLLDNLVAPLLRRIGEHWEAGLLNTVHEHVASEEIRRFLNWLVHTARVEGNAPALAVTTPSGQQMELGALMVAATAAAEGWRVAWLGPDLPAAEIIRGAQHLKPAAVAISLVHQTRDPGLTRELELVARGFAGRTPLLVGGRAAPAHALLLERLGATVMPDLGSLRRWLRAHRGTQLN